LESADWCGRATAKYWLYFLKGYPNRQDPEVLPKTVAKYVCAAVSLYPRDSLLTVLNRLHANVIVQWDKLEKRLSDPNQQYIALPDRPTLADISYFPFAMPWMFRFLQVNVEDWPHIEEWGKRMLARPAVQAILERGPKYGHDID
jgi:glutathione S-transferase